MTCYHPNIIIQDRSKPYKTLKCTTAYKTTIERAKDEFERLETLKKYTGKNYRKYIVPCGKCIGCRLDYSREWANRGYLESLLYKENWFITLTYDENQKPLTDYYKADEKKGEWIRTPSTKLKPEDLTKFLKKLRRYMEYHHKQYNLRYMACGEYGTETRRPHYHVILFNCHFPTESFYNPKLNNKNMYYRNKIIEKCWTKGISNISECSWNTIAYTARYITKKINGQMEQETYEQNEMQKEFFRVSKMPGIGKPYYDLYKDKIYKNDEIIIHTSNGTESAKPPTYFDKLYAEENPKEWEKIRKKRERLAEKKNKVKDKTTSLTRLEQLEVEERTKAEQGSKLIRSMEKKKQTN